LRFDSIMGGERADERGDGIDPTPIPTKCLLK